MVLSDTNAMCKLSIAWLLRWNMQIYVFLCTYIRIYVCVCMYVYMYIHIFAFANAWSIVIGF